MSMHIIIGMSGNEFQQNVTFLSETPSCVHTHISVRETTGVPITGGPHMLMSKAVIQSKAGSSIIYKESVNHGPAHISYSPIISETYSL